MKKPLLLILLLLFLLPVSVLADLLTVQQDTTIYVISQTGTLNAAGTLPSGYQLTLDGVEAPVSGPLADYFLTTAQPIWYRATFRRGSETMTGYLLANPGVVTGVNPNRGQNVLPSVAITQQPWQSAGMQGYAGQSYSGQVYAGQGYNGQAYAGQSYNAPLYSGMNYGGQTYGGLNDPQQTYAGQSYGGINTGTQQSMGASEGYPNHLTYTLNGTSDSVSVFWSREGLNTALTVSVSGTTAIDSWSLSTFTGQSLGTMTSVGSGWTGSATAGELLVIPAMKGTKLPQWAFAITTDGARQVQTRQVLTNSRNDRLNFRVSPSRTAAAPTQLNGGSVVYVLDSRTNEGTLWDCVYWNGMFGYVDDSFLTPAGQPVSVLQESAAAGSTIARQESNIGSYAVTAVLTVENGQYVVRIDSLMTALTDDDIMAWQVYVNNNYAGDAQTASQGSGYEFMIGTGEPDSVILAPYLRKSGIKTDQVIYLK